MKKIFLAAVAVCVLGNVDINAASPLVGESTKDESTKKIFKPTILDTLKNISCEDPIKIGAVCLATAEAYFLSKSPTARKGFLAGFVPTSIGAGLLSSILFPTGKGSDFYSCPESSSAHVARGVWAGCIGGTLGSLVLCAVSKITG